MDSAAMGVDPQQRADGLRDGRRRAAVMDFLKIEKNAAIVDGATADPRVDIAIRHPARLTRCSLRRNSDPSGWPKSRRAAGVQQYLAGRGGRRANIERPSPAPKEYDGFLRAG